MKRSLFLVIGFIIIVLLFAFWIYSLLYGTPKSAGEIFADFGLFGRGETTDFPPTNDQIITETPVVDVVTARLRQLTTRPVIGFYESFSTSTEPRHITYAEAGTGHIYTINMTTGEETRLSNITVPSAQKAAFSQNGEFAAIRSGYTNQSEVTLIDMREMNNISTYQIKKVLADFSFSNNQLLFIEETPTGTVGYSLNPMTKASSEIFSVPFLSATVRWSNEVGTPHYIYPKATSRLPGYLYEINNGRLKRLPVSGNGLIAESARDFIVYSRLEGQIHQSSIYFKNEDITGPAPIIVIPEKCGVSPADHNLMYCGSTFDEYNYSFPDDWYKGTRTFSDSIWSVNIPFQSATQLINPLSAVGREIDITNMTVARDGSMLYFTNKNDNTLWAYEI